MKAYGMTIKSFLARRITGNPFYVLYFVILDVKEAVFVLSGRWYCFVSTKQYVNTKWILFFDLLGLLAHTGSNHSIKRLYLL